MTDHAPTHLSSVVLQKPLEHIMDARCENLHQDALIFDPSPAQDSIAEFVAALLRPGVDPATVVAPLLELLRKLAESNAREGQHELAASGVLDELMRSLHQRGNRSPLTVKAAARRLRGALRTLSDHPDGVAYFRASCEIKDVIAALTPDVLYGRGLRHELGKDRSQQFDRLLDDQQAVAA